MLRAKLGTGKWTGYEFLNLAKELGYFERRGVEVSICDGIEENESVEKLKAGELDGAGLSLDVAINLNYAGTPVKAVLILDYSLGGDKILARLGFNEASELSEAKIGVLKSYSNMYFLARAALEADIDLKKAEISYYEKFEDLKAALKAGKIDAAAVNDPYGARLETLGYKELFSSRDMPGAIIDALVFRKEFAERNSSAVEGIISAWFDALNYKKRNKKKAIERMAAMEGVEPSEFEKSLDSIKIPSFKENLAFFDLESAEDVFKTSDIAADFFKKKGKLPRDYDLRELFDAKYLNNLKRD